MKKFRTIGECVADKLKDKKVIQVPSSLDTFIELQKIALKYRTSVSEIIRTLINDFLDSEKSTAGEATA